MPMGDAVERRPLHERVLIVLATAAAFALLAWVAAHWFWRWASPSAAPLYSAHMRAPAATCGEPALWHVAHASASRSGRAGAMSCAPWQAEHSGFPGSPGRCPPAFRKRRSAVWHCPHTLATSPRLGGAAP